MAPNMTVTPSVGSGGGGGLPTPVGPGSVSIVERQSSNLGIAPYAVMLEAVATGFTGVAAASRVYEPAYHRLDYEWQADRAGQTYDRLDRVPDEFKDVDVSYGPLFTHVFPEGTFNVTCIARCWATGEVQHDTFTITVAAQDTQFSGSNTILIDTTGSWTGATSYSGAPVRTSWANALSDIQGDQSTPKRVIFRSGQTHSFTAFGVTTNAWPTVYIVGEPGQAAPTLTQDGEIYWGDSVNTQGAGGKDLVFQNINVRSDPLYDSSTYSNLPSSRFILAAASQTSLGSIVTDDCDFTGLGMFLEGSTVQSETWLFMHDTGFYDWASTVMIADTIGGVGVSGCQFLHDTDALVGRTGVNSLLGGFRFDCPYACFTNIEAFNRHGWTTDPTSGYYFSQAFLRGNNNSTSGDKVNVQMLAIEAGYSLINLQETNNTGMTAMNAVIERCDLMGNMTNNTAFIFAHGGITVRNCRIMFPDTDYVNTDPRSLVWIDELGNPSNADIDDAPILLYNNLIYSSATSGRWFNNTVQDIPMFNGSIAGTREVTEANNIRHQPNLSGGAPDAPIDLTTTQTPRSLDYRDAENLTPIAGTATPVTGSWIEGTPQTGSAAIGDATITDVRLVAGTDRLGNVRPAQPSRGPLEPTT